MDNIIRKYILYKNDLWIPSNQEDINFFKNMEKVNILNFEMIEQGTDQFIFMNDYKIAFYYSCDFNYIKIYSNYIMYQFKEFHKVIFLEQILKYYGFTGDFTNLLIDFGIE